jgi:hypothetical protein
MNTDTTKKTPAPLLVRGRNAMGKLIDGLIPAGELPTEDPGLAIQQILANHKNIEPTPVSPND